MAFAGKIAHKHMITEQKV